MICVQEMPDGSLSVVSPQPADVGTCTAVVISPAEASGLGFWQALAIPDAVAIGSAAWFCWAVVFGFRVLMRQSDSLSSNASGD